MTFMICVPVFALKITKPSWVAVVAREITTKTMTKKG